MDFCAAQHLFMKAMNSAGVLFPASKKEIINKLGDVVVQIGEDRFELAAEIVKKIEVEEFPCGSAFWCAYTAAVMQEAKEQMESVKKIHT